MFFLSLNPPSIAGLFLSLPSCTLLGPPDPGRMPSRLLPSDPQRYAVSILLQQGFSFFSFQVLQRLSSVCFNDEERPLSLVIDIPLSPRSLLSSSSGPPSLGIPLPSRSIPQIDDPQSLSRLSSPFDFFRPSRKKNRPPRRKVSSPRLPMSGFPHWMIPTGLPPGTVASRIKRNFDPPPLPPSFRFPFHFSSFFPLTPFPHRYSLFRRQSPTFAPQVSLFWTQTRWIFPPLTRRPPFSSIPA